MARSGPTFDPDGLTAAQRYGEACVVCHKKWPRPRAHVGRLPDDSRVFACDDCVPALRIIPQPVRRRTAKGKEPRRRSQSLTRA
jgi:hypothetical protein